MKSEIDRFVLEQQIYDCWSIIDDIKLVCESDDLTAVEKNDILKLVATLGDIKFKKLMTILEALIKQRDLV